MKYTGVTQEFVTTFEEDSISEKVEMYFGGMVGGTKWSNGVFVQVYAQFEDPENPG